MKYVRVLKKSNKTSKLPKCLPYENFPPHTQKTHKYWIYWQNKGRSIFQSKQVLVKIKPFRESQWITIWILSTCIMKGTFLPRAQYWCNLEKLWLKKKEHCQCSYQKVIWFHIRILKTSLSLSHPYFWLHKSALLTAN